MWGNPDPSCRAPPGFSFVRPDVALVDGGMTFTAPRGEPDVTRFTSVWVKADGRWRIRSGRDLTPAPATETVAAHRLREPDWLIGEWVSEGKDSAVRLRPVTGRFRGRHRTA